MDKELLLIAVYGMVDDHMKQPALLRQLERAGRKPKLSDGALMSLALLQELSGMKDEDAYWQYVWREHGSYF